MRLATSILTLSLSASLLSLNARAEGAAPASRLDQQISEMKSEASQRQELEQYAYDLGKDLCYIFQFRHNHDLTLRTRWYNFPYEDAMIALYIRTDAKLRATIKAWTTLSWYGFIAPYYHNVGTIVSSESLMHDRLQHSPELYRAVKDCGDEVHADFTKVFYRELDLLDTSQGFMSSYGLFTLAGGVGAGGGFFASVIRKIVGVVGVRVATIGAAALTVGGIGIAVTSVVQEGDMRKTFVADAKAEALGQISSRNSFAEGVIDDNLNTAITSFGVQFVQLKDKSQLPANLIKLSNLLDKYPLTDQYEKLKKQIDSYPAGVDGLRLILEKQKNKVQLSDDEQAMLDKLHALGSLQIYFNWKKSLTTVALEKNQ